MFSPLERIVYPEANHCPFRDARKKRLVWVNFSFFRSSAYGDRIVTSSSEIHSDLFLGFISLTSSPRKPIVNSWFKWNTEMNACKAGIERDKYVCKAWEFFKILPRRLIHDARESPREHLCNQNVKQRMRPNSESDVCKYPLELVWLRALRERDDIMLK